MRHQTGRVFLLLCAFLAPLLAEDNLKYGQPACAGKVLDKDYFVLCYDPGLKLPRWVGYALTREDAMARAIKRTGDFRADPALPAAERAQNSDYAGTVYDKGHMAPANDFTRSKQAMRATFVLTNAVPQTAGLNRGEWKEVEDRVHTLAEKEGAIWVFSGPVFIGKAPVKTIGRDKVAVPTHTYKVVLCVHPDGSKEMFGFLLPNVSNPAASLASYAVSVNEVERLTGLDFFGALPAAEQNRLQRRAALPGR